LLEAELPKRFWIEDALRHPWLQPVTEPSVREELNLAVPDAAIERRQARVSSVARRRLRVSALKVMAMRRLSEGGLSADALRDALHASPLRASAKQAERPGSGQTDGGSSIKTDKTDGGMTAVVPPSANLLQALADQQHLEQDSFVRPSIKARRMSEESIMSYKSESMGGRSI